MASVGLFSIINSQTKVRKPPVKGLTKPLVCKAFHCGTGYSEVWQGIRLYVSHHLLEQTTLILCSYLEVTLILKQVWKAKTSKKYLFIKSKINTTVTKIYKDMGDKIERKLHLIYLFQD